MADFSEQDKVNYYRRYSGDYLRDTSKLSVLEHGAYSLLLDYYYSEETPLPLDLEEVYTMVRAMKPADRAAVDKVLARYFEAREDGYHNNRADQELHIATTVIETARENGKLGGRPKKNLDHNPEGNPEDNPQGNPDETQNITREQSGMEPANNHPPTTNHQPPTTSLQPPIKNKGKGSAQAPFVLPEWIPAEPWNAWIEARTKARHPPTVYAKRLAVLKLENLRDQGHEPAQVLMNAAFNNWTGLWPPKEP